EADAAAETFGNLLDGKHVAPAFPPGRLLPARLADGADVLPAVRAESPLHLLLYDGNQSRQELRVLKGTGALGQAPDVEPLEGVAGDVVLEHAVLPAAGRGRMPQWRAGGATRPEEPTSRVRRETQPSLRSPAAPRAWRARRRPGRSEPHATCSGRADRQGLIQSPGPPRAAAGGGAGGGRAA